MEFFPWLFDFILHIDAHLADIVTAYGWQTYLMLFVVIFWETGVVVWPFLPGDSLLFAAGSISALPGAPLAPLTLFLLLDAAAITGDTANYWLGRAIGPRAFHGDGRFLKRKYLEKTESFYDKYGARTIVLARFVPIVRTFAPFVAGLGRMHYRRFLAFNCVGATLWTALFIGAGYFFGNLAAVRHNFSLVILAIIVISLLPMAVEAAKARRAGRQ